MKTIEVNLVYDDGTATALRIVRVPEGLDISHLLRCVHAKAAAHSVLLNTGSNLDGGLEEETLTYVRRGPLESGYYRLDVPDAAKTHKAIDALDSWYLVSALLE